MSNGNKVDPLTQHLQTYTQEREPDFGSRLLEAMSHLAVEYGREPIELMEQTHRYLQGNTSGKKVLVGDTWMDAEAIPLAQALAGEFMGGGMAARMANSPPPGSVGIFGGSAGMREHRYRAINEGLEELENIQSKRAKTKTMEEWNELNEQYKQRQQELESLPIRQTPEVEHRFNKAQDMYQDISLKDPTPEQLDNIRKETGWFKPEWYRKSPKAQPGDTKWRFEIDDSKMDWKKTVEGQPKIEIHLNNAINRSSSNLPQPVIKLKDILEHKELFESYPNLQDYKIKFLSPSLESNVDGYFRPYDNEIAVSAKYPPKQLKPILLHELQHAVQHIEGFSSGTSTLYTEFLFADLTHNLNKVDKALKNYASIKENPDSASPALQELVMKNDKADLAKKRADYQEQLDEMHTHVDAYRMNPGEQEARDVELRFKMVTDKTLQRDIRNVEKQTGQTLPEDIQPYGILTFGVNSKTGKYSSIDYSPAPSVHKATKTGEITHSYE